VLTGVLILMHGLPATGKTTLAQELARSIKADILSSDRIRRRVFPDVPELPPASEPEARLEALDQYRSEHPDARLNLQRLLRPLREADYPIPPELDRESYRQREDVKLDMLAEAQRLLSKGRHVILDATNIEYQATTADGRIFGRAVYRDIARRTLSRFYIVSLHCPDETVIRARLASRAGRGEEASEARTKIFEDFRHIAEQDENRFQAEETPHLIILDVETGEVSTSLLSSEFILGEVQQAWDAIRRKFA
jgi:predicted kinase